MSPGDKKKKKFFLSLFVAFVVYTDFLSPGDKNEFLLAGLFFFSLHKLWICAREKKFYFCARAQATKKIRVGRQKRQKRQKKINFFFVARRHFFRVVQLLNAKKQRFPNS
jgi:hypothetical protein